MKAFEAKEYARTIGKCGIIPGLERIQKLLQELGSPQNGLNFVHVAGTNGKGSVIAYLSSVLKTAGYKVGAYTSPAVFDDMEVFSVNGAPIHEETYGRLMGQIKAAREKMQERGEELPTLFEVETALAFLYFQEEACDIVLLEAGMGGKLDATNCIPTPLCAVITSIGMDHMAALGSTIEEIAWQKAGIIKGAQVVSAPQKEEVLNVLKAVCQEKQAELCVVDGTKLQGTMLFYKTLPPVQLPLLGEHQLKNAAIAIEVIEKLRSLDYNISDEQIISGLRAAKWPGRLTVLGKEPLLVMDGAHNEQAAQCLKRALELSFPGTEWCFIMGVLADKEYEKIISCMAPLGSEIYTITPGHARAFSGSLLAESIERAGYRAVCKKSVEDAQKDALFWCGKKKNRGVLAFGSLSFLREWKEAVLKQAAFCGAYEKGAKMEKVSRIIRNPLFLEKMEQLEVLEKDRQFCRHGMQHCMDVARGCALINEERMLGFSKEMLYALALVHDIGRGEQYLRGIPHEEASAGLAKQILGECGFTKQDVDKMANAIRLHRSREALKDGLAALLIEADKQTRLCFACKAQETCNWPLEIRNREICL